MARRQYTQISAVIGVRLGSRDDVTSTLIEYWLNDALLLTALTFIHPQLQQVSDETLVANADQLTPVASVLWPDAVKELTNGRVLWPDDKENIERITTKATQPPSRFYWWNNVFTFDTKPSAGVTIRIWSIKRPDYWTSGVSPLAIEYDPIVEGYAAMLGYKHLRDLDNMKAEKNMVDQHALQMKLPVREEKKLDYQSRVRGRGPRYGGR